MDALTRKVLDHGFVRLVSHTQPAVPTPAWSADLEVVRSARVSYNADWRTGADKHKDGKLLERMLLTQHSTPFEAITFTFEVMAPIFVFRQWHRHRTWGYNELSARYAALPEIYWLPEPSQMTGQHTTDKQMRGDGLIAHPELAIAYMTKSNNEAFALYKQLMAQGVAREIARSVLPMATYSRMFATVNLGNLLKFLLLRMDKHAQHEIRVYANALEELVTPIAPMTMRAFNTSFKVRQFIEMCIDRARVLEEDFVEFEDIQRVVYKELQKELT